jgi:hypothetical protein
MASFIVYGDSSGQVTVAAPAAAGTNTITFPAETGTLVTTATTTALPGQIAWDTTVKTSGFTAVAYGGYFCNTTSAAFTVTLPAAPTRGQFVVIVDYAGTAGTNNITIGRNGSNINGVAGDATIKTNRQGLTLTYIDSTQGWLASSNVYSGNPPFGQQVPISYLVVAGGGGGGNNFAGGGGAGGLLTSTATLTQGVSYTITVGGGGVGQTSGGYNGSAGANSVLSGSGITTQTAIGGGAGQGDRFELTGINGGSGGGASKGGGTIGTGTPGQGNNGAIGATSSGGGGGGAGGAGSAGSGPQGGNGGIASSSSITGTPAFYAGGGGGGAGNTTSVPGGAGGPGTPGVSGGNGGDRFGGSNRPASVGVANTGGGGGGGNWDGYGNNSGANGGSGVVILSVPTSLYSGTTTGSPTVTTSGSNTILKYTASGTYTA